MTLGTWIHDNEPCWFTEFGMGKYKELQVLQEGEGSRIRRKRIKDEWLAMLRIDMIKPVSIMEGYISKIANQKTLKPLSPAGYGGKRTAVFHLIRCHNGRGPTQDFQDEMTSLWKGFSRTTNKRKMRARRQPRQGDDNEPPLKFDVKSVSSGSDVEDEEEDDNCDKFKEGKEPMSPELYRNVCKWLLEWGNLDGIFAALFIVLSWNLVCRGNNTSKVRLSHWSVFNALQVNFKHTKVDQPGDTKRKKRHLFSNVYEYYIDLPFLMGLYFSCCFNFAQSRGR
jgi:hypothetical protein